MLGSDLNRTVSAPRKHLDVPNWKVSWLIALGSSPSLPVAKIFILEPNATHPQRARHCPREAAATVTFSGESRRPGDRTPILPLALSLSDLGHITTPLKTSVGPLFLASISAYRHESRRPPRALNWHPPPDSSDVCFLHRAPQVRITDSSTLEL